MNKIKLLSIAVTGLLLINIGILAFLFLRKPMHSPGDEPMGKGPRSVIIEKLHFDKEQVAEYEKLITIHQQTIQELDGQIRETKKQLYTTLAAETGTNKDSLQNKLGEIQKKIESVHFSHFEAIKKLCKPGQMEYFKSLTGELAKYFVSGKKSPQPPRD